MCFSSIASLLAPLDMLAIGAKHQPNNQNSKGKEHDQLGAWGVQTFKKSSIYYNLGIITSTLRVVLTSTVVAKSVCDRLVVLCRMVCDDDDTL